MEESVKNRTVEFVKAKGIKMKVFEERCGLSSDYLTSMRKGFGPDKLTKKEATPILGEASCGKLCMCTRFSVFVYIYFRFPNL